MAELTDRQAYLITSLIEDALGEGVKTPDLTFPGVRDALEDARDRLAPAAARYEPGQTGQVTEEELEQLRADSFVLQRLIDEGHVDADLAAQTQLEMR